jgi:hypothetical protein
MNKYEESASSTFSLQTKRSVIGLRNGKCGILQLFFYFIEWGLLAALEHKLEYRQES